MQSPYDQWRGNRWPWLAYLIFVPFPWLWVKPDATTLLAAVVAVVLFVPLYFASFRVSNAAMPFFAAAMLAIGGTLAHETSASLAALETAGIAPLVTGDPAAVPADAGAVLAMTLREAVTNVIRHAGARHCAIGFEAGPGDARLVVEDDGVGLSFREGNGLRGMRQRLTAAGGRLELRALQPGTRLEASVPA